jgi:hypothetical protein
MKREELRMTCEEFIETSFDFDRRDARVSESHRAAAEAHLRDCAACATQMESWRNLRARLRELAEETQGAQTPERVELQLRRKVMLLGYQSRWNRRKTTFATVALAAAAGLIVAVGVWRWEQNSQRARVARGGTPAEAGSQEAARGPRLSTESAPGAVQEAALTQDEFVPLPGSVAIPGDEGTIVQMRMQRGALGALGLAVNQEESDDWIDVDLLVSVDGQPEAVRLARSGGT